MLIHLLITINKIINFTIFGYTQVLFMGSVPRINCLLINVPIILMYSSNNTTIYITILLYYGIGII